MLRRAHFRRVSKNIEKLIEKHSSDHHFKNLKGTPRLEKIEEKVHQILQKENLRIKRLHLNKEFYNIRL